MAFHKSVHGKQPGDPAKAAQRMVDVLTLFGLAAGRTEVPVRLALGRDCYDIIKTKCESSLALLEEWKDISFGTGTTALPRLPSKPIPFKTKIKWKI